MQEQIRKADWVLDKLSSFGAVVAGGAPRDWYYGEEANDIDVFIPGEVDKEQIKEALGLLDCNLVDLLGRGYIGSFTGWSFEDEEGQTFQILCHDKSSVEEIVNSFPLSVSKAIYYGNGVFWYDDWFHTGEKWKVVVCDETVENFSWRYLDKILPRFQGYYVAWSPQEALTRIGKGLVGYPSPDVPEEAVDLVQF